MFSEEGEFCHSLEKQPKRHRLKVFEELRALIKNSNAGILRLTPETMICPSAF
jgi:hypothetical protein